LTVELIGRCDRGGVNRKQSRATDAPIQFVLFNQVSQIGLLDQVLHGNHNLFHYNFETFAHLHIAIVVLAIGVAQPRVAIFFDDFHFQNGTEGLLLLLRRPWFHRDRSRLQPGTRDFCCLFFCAIGLNATQTSDSKAADRCCLWCRSPSLMILQTDGGRGGQLVGSQSPLIGLLGDRFSLLGGPRPAIAWAPSVRRSMASAIPWNRASPCAPSRLVLRLP